MEEKTERDRLIAIEVQVEGIKKSIDDIKDNHLKSIYEAIKCLERRMLSRFPFYITIIVSFLSSLCIGLIVYGVMKK